MEEWVVSVIESYSAAQRIIVFSTINGYHAYHRRPLPIVDFPLVVEPEPTNRFDKSAMVVTAPSVVPEFRLHLPTRLPPSSPQCVADILGKTIGHVPAKLCTVMSDGMKDGEVKSVSTVHIGGFVHGGPVRGGGPKLRCLYIVDVNVVNVKLSAIHGNLRRCTAIPEENVFIIN